MRANKTEPTLEHRKERVVRVGDKGIGEQSAMRPNGFLLIYAYLIFPFNFTYLQPMQDQEIQLLTSLHPYQIS